VSVFSRPAAEGDVILGARPETVYEPSTVDEAGEVLRESALGGKTLAFIGGGTDLELGTAPRRIDAVVRTGRLARVVEHSPSDQIVVAEAGLTLGELQRTFASHRQRLALDPPLPERKTVGGIIAANAYGPRRARFGSVRDLIIGISFMRADGTLARGGGKVVKNVAGFDLPKLMIGSLGTLGLITTVNFRLHPLPEEEVTLHLPGRSGAGLRSLVRGIKEAQLEPTSVVAAWREADRFDVAVRFEGLRAGIAEQCERLTGLVRREAAGACETLDEPAARAFWSRHDEVRTTGALRAKITALPTHVECGALSIHSGRGEEALAFARDTIARFEAVSGGGPVDAILVNAAGCGSNLKDYGRLFADDPIWSARAAAFSAKVRDVTEFLAGLPPVAPRHPLRARVAYHDACHLAHAQGIRGEPRKLLAGIPGLELVEIPDSDQCCGSAGIYNLVQPESSEEIGARKVNNVLSVKPDLLASANPGCTLQIQKLLRQRGQALPAAHPIEILDASISGRPLPK